jgi:hypothetical protein
MPWACRIAAVFIVAAISCWFAFGRQDFRTPEGAWHDDYAKALAEAKQTGKLLFVVITCPH